MTKLVCLLLLEITVSVWHYSPIGTVLNRSYNLFIFIWQKVYWKFKLVVIYLELFIHYDFIGLLCQSNVVCLLWEPQPPLDHNGHWNDNRVGSKQLWIEQVISNNDTWSTIYIHKIKFQKSTIPRSLHPIQISLQPRCTFFW